MEEDIDGSILFVGYASIQDFIIFLSRAQHQYKISHYTTTRGDREKNSQYQIHPPSPHIPRSLVVPQNQVHKRTNFRGF